MSSRARSNRVVETTLTKREISRGGASDAESRRIIREELLTNLLVEAGAGSGKTQMLAERMAAGVASGDYQIEHMAAVTFTRKAAAELRGRFQLALEAELAATSEPALQHPSTPAPQHPSIPLRRYANRTPCESSSPMMTASTRRALR